MADDQASAPSDDPNKVSEGKPESRDDAKKTEAEVIPPEAEEVIRKAMEAGGPKALLSVFGEFSRTTGPDPQTIKVLAEVEKHAEDSRLKGYQATLANRDKQAERDHAFRIKSLNHASVKSGIILGVAVIGVVTGLYLWISGSQQIGGYMLFASFMAIWQVLGDKQPFGSG